MRPPGRLGWALIVGLLVLLLSRSPLAALVLGGAVALFPQLLARPRGLGGVPPAAGDIEASAAGATGAIERETDIEVVCKAVTPERQEWVSSKTGRLYDVLAPDGLPNAEPGDRGYVTLSGSSWRIRSKE